MTSTFPRSFTVNASYKASAPWSDPAPTTYLTTTTVSEKRGKDSIDVGVFTPGVYRVNPYFVMKQAFNLKSATISNSYAVGSWKYSKHISGYLTAKGMNAAITKFPSLGSASTLKSMVLQKALAKLGQNDVGLGENLGELRETIQMLRHPFKDLRDFLLDPTTKNLGTVKQLLTYSRNGDWIVGRKRHTGVRAAKMASSTWLEFRYGLMPLVYTIQDIMELVKKKAEVLDATKIRVVRANSSESFNYSTVLSWGHAMDSYTGDFVASDVYTVFASVQYQQTAPIGNLDVLGLGPRFLPELVWELTQLSFVVDWWFSIGDFLGSLRVTPEIKILGNTVGVKATRRVTVTGKYTIASSSPLPPKIGEIPNCGTWDLEQYTRTCGEHHPYTPLLKLQFKSYLHTVDAVALSLQKILQLLPRRKRP